MKFATGLLVATISFLMTLASDTEKDITGVPPRTAEQEDLTHAEPLEEEDDQEDEPQVVEETNPKEDDDEDEEEDEEEQDETFDRRKNIVQTLEFCLRKGDITPSELVNCASDILIGGGTNPNPAFMKCVGEYVTCTHLTCNALLAEYDGDDVDYSDAFKCLGSCVPQLVRCLARSTPIPSHK